MKRYLKVWWIFATNAVQSQITMRWALLFLLFGKLLRFGIFTFFIIILVSNTQALAGYTLNETLFFFFTFNLVDILSQSLYRDVYRFRQAVVTGNFDYFLIRPINTLFRSLSSGPDLLDFVTLIPLLGGIVYLAFQIQFNGIWGVIFYLLLLFLSFLIATGFYILVLCLGILTTEIDHAIMVYRDISALGRFPIEIYKEPLRGILTFILPVGLMMTFPVKALLGLLSPYFVVYAFVFALGFFYLSVKAWDWSVRQYSSASS